jgi:hypothetical protein
VRRSNSLVVVIVLVALLVVFGLAALFVVAIWQSSSPFVSLSSILAPFCSVFIILVVLIVAAAAGAFQRRPSLPPPPQVQQPMVPAGLVGPIAINCPNCGAPPELVDRFGVATCSHCNTRFIVR